MAQAFPANIEVRRVDRSHDPILRNLFAYYLHDMAEWFLLDADKDGRYSYSTEKHWQGGADVYLAYCGRIPVGFALVGSAETHGAEFGARDLDAFFVVRRHRRAGVGRALATHVWDATRGPWLVRVFQGNQPALPFWRGEIQVYTGGRFREEVREVRERRWSYFTFDSTA